MKHMIYVTCQSKFNELCGHMTKEKNNAIVWRLGIKLHVVFRKEKDKILQDF